MFLDFILSLFENRWKVEKQIIDFVSGKYTFFAFNIKFWQNTTLIVSELILAPLFWRSRDGPPGAGARTFPGSLTLGQPGPDNNNYIQVQV